MGDVDMLLENNIILDKQIYDLWLQGYSAAEAADVMKDQKFDLNFEVSLDILLSEVHDHFRLYTMMEPLMKHPLRMKDEMLFQLSPVVKGVLIERYYGFDAEVMREILNKKISSRSRSSLDDISEKTRVYLRSCRRQFDNLKRVFKVVEDLSGNLVENIKLNFLLSTDLAQKKLAFMTFDSFLRCATVVIDNWSYSCKGANVAMSSEESSADLQKDFVCALRELKALSDRDNLDEHKILVMRYLQGRLPSSVHVEVEDNFRTLAKALINIAGGLIQSKELRDFFYDLAEKLVEPCKQLELSQRVVSEFFVVYRETSSRLDFFVRQHPSLLPAWETYLTTVSKCVDIMYT